MATSDEYDQSGKLLREGKGNSIDRQRVEREAKQAGSRGNRAREALKIADAKKH